MDGKGIKSLEEMRDVMDGMAVGISCGSRLGFARLKEWISLACGIVIHMPLASYGSHMI